MFDRHLSFLPIELVVRMALVMGLRAVLNQRGFEGRFESIKKNLDKILRPLTAWVLYIIIIIIIRRKKKTCCSVKFWLDYHYFAVLRTHWFIKTLPSFCVKSQRHLSKGRRRITLQWCSKSTRTREDTGMFRRLLWKIWSESASWNVFFIKLIIFRIRVEEIIKRNFLWSIWHLLEPFFGVKLGLKKKNQLPVLSNFVHLLAC